MDIYYDYPSTNVRHPSFHGNWNPDLVLPNKLLVETFQSYKQAVDSAFLVPKQIKRNH